MRRHGTTVAVVLDAGEDGDAAESVSMSVPDTMRVGDVAEDARGDGGGCHEAQWQACARMAAGAKVRRAYLRRC